jgi:hypothetical protein
MKRENRKAVNTFGTTLGVAGFISSLFFCPVLAIPAALAVAKGIKNFKDLHEEEEEEKVRKEVDMLPARRGFLPESYNYGLPLGISPGLIPENPITTLARQSPHRAHNVMIWRSLDETHESIVAPAAAEFARQGKGTFARTSRRGGFFSGPSVETIIKPI